LTRGGSEHAGTHSSKGKKLSREEEYEMLLMVKRSPGKEVFTQVLLWVYVSRRDLNKKKTLWGKKRKKKGGDVKSKCGHDIKLQSKISGPVKIVKKGGARIENPSEEEGKAKEKAIGKGDGFQKQEKFMKSDGGD